MENVNISRNKLVPEHIKLTEEEKQEVLNELNVALSQLPKISASDPAIKDMSAQSGDLIKVLRISPTNKMSIFYRVVTGG